MRAHILILAVLSFAATTNAAVTMAWAWSVSNTVLTLTGSGDITVNCALNIPGGDKFMTEATMCTQTAYYAAYKALSATAGMFVVIDKTNSIINGAVHVTIGTDGSNTANFASTNSAEATALIAAGSYNIQTILAGLESLTSESAPSGPMSLYIYNHIEFDFTESTTASGFKTWSLDGPLNRGYMRTLSIEFDPAETSPSATTTFTCNGLSFTISASKSGSTNVVTVDWGSFGDYKDVLIVPAPESSASSLGYYEGGIVNIGLFKPTSETSNMGTQSSTWKSKWMELYAACLNDQEIYKIAFPGSHDTGSSDFNSDFQDYFGQTTTTEITAQLDNGMRSFDLRIATADNSAFTLTHGGLVSYSGGAAYTIDALLAAVTTWLGTNTEEIVLLNFNRFLHIASGTFDHAALITKVDAALGNKIIDCSSYASSKPFLYKINRQVFCHYSCKLYCPHLRYLG